LRIVQGSYNKGVTQSGGTHDGGGALDISVFNMTAAQRDRVVRELRETSFAAWYRPPIPGVWGAHIHAIAIGDQEMSPQAAQQVVWYKQGLNGLWPSGGGPDTGPDVPIHVYRQDIDMSYYGPDKWDDADWQEFFNHAGWGYDLNNLNTDPVTKVNARTSLEYAHQHATDADAKATLAATGVANLNTKVNLVETKVDTVLEELGKLVKLVPPPIPPV
jgi:hypothetical protein